MAEFDNTNWYVSGLRLWKMAGAPPFCLTCTNLPGVE